MARARFQLLAGKHIGPDLTAQPVETYNPDTGEMVQRVDRDPRTGRLTYRYPSRIYDQGESFDSDVDLCERFGEAKFRKLSDSPSTTEELPEQKGVRSSKRDGEETRSSDAFEDTGKGFPNGQQSSGHQATVGGIPGPQTAEDADRVAKEVATVRPESLNVDPPTKAPTASKTPIMGRTPGEGDKDVRTVGKSHQEFSRSELEKKSKKELEDLAEEHEIDTEGCHTKEDIIRKFGPKK